MIKPTLFSILLLGAATLDSPRAAAALLVSTSIQGHVTGAATESSIEVDGRTYRIDTHSDARYAWKKIERGDVVVLTLNGAVTNPDTKVVAINVQQP